MTDTSTIVVTIWLSVLTGAATVVGTLYGVFMSQKQRHRDGEQRMRVLADIAVRRTEAAFVRPIIRQRMLTVLTQEEDNANSNHSSDGGGALHRRVRLFVALEKGIRLTEPEKASAHRSAINHLVVLLRAAPNPPLNINGESQMRRHAVYLSGLIEAAYGLRPRLAAEAIRSVGEFCHGIVDDVHLI